MNSISNQLIKYRRDNNLTQEALAAIIGVKRSTLSAYEQSRAEPPLSLLFDLHKLKIVNINEIFKLKENLFDTTPAKLKILAITVDNEDNENIEFVNEKASAGYAGSYSDPEFIKSLPKFRIPNLKNGTYRAFEIRGDSMLPIQSGSVIIGQYVESLKDLKINQTYIFITMTMGIAFKRVAAITKKEVTLRSDNPVYEDYTLPLEEIDELWKTKLFMSYQFPEPDDKLSRIESRIQTMQDQLTQIQKK